MVQISMDCFVKRFQPERYDLWKAGKDVQPHPEDDTRKLYAHKSKDNLAITSGSTNQYVYTYT